MRLRKFTWAIIALMSASVSAMPFQHGPIVSKDPISGDWDVSFEVQGTKVPATFKLKLTGDKVSGTAESQHTGPGKLSDGTWAEDKLSFTLVFAAHDSIAVTGTLKDGNLSGEFRTEGRQSTWIAKRVGSASTNTQLPNPNQYAPYSFLIGTWNVTAESGGPTLVIERFTWGPNHSYLWFASSLIMKDAEEPHFEGMLVWDGVRKNLAMLLVVDLRQGLVSEQGTVFVESDGTVVRDIVGVYSEGVTPMGQPKVGPGGWKAHFRQTFKAVGTDKVLTNAMRETEQGWVATFPGSDHLMMTRRP